MRHPTTVILPIALMALAISWFLVLVDYSTSPIRRASAGPETIGCSDDIKICSDGSTVRRISPNCEFAACPEPFLNDNNANRAINVNSPDDDLDGEIIACATDVRSCSDGSYIQRVPPACEFADCPPGTEPVPLNLNQ